MVFDKIKRDLNKAKWKLVQPWMDSFSDWDFVMLCSAPFDHKKLYSKVFTLYDHISRYKIKKWVNPVCCKELCVTIVITSLLARVCCYIEHLLSFWVNWLRWCAYSYTTRPGCLKLCLWKVHDQKVVDTLEQPCKLLTDKRSNKSPTSSSCLEGARH